MDNINNEVTYPDKPSVNTKKKDISKSIANALLFLLVSYYYFNKDIHFVIIVFIVLMIHELGHLLAMRFFNYKDLKIFFIPILGAYTSGSKKEVSQKQNAIIYLCGPIPGILLGIVLYYYSLNIHSNLLYEASYVFFLINLFNLLPIKPLDGGNLISNLLIKDNKIAEKGFIIFSIITMVGASIYLKSYVLFIIPIFMAIGQLKQNKIERIKKTLAQQGFNFNLSFDNLSDKEYWIIRTEIVKNFKFFQKIDPDLLEKSEQEDKIADYVKLITVEKTLIKDMSSDFRKKVLLILLLSFIIPVYYVGIIKGNNNQNIMHKKLYEQLTYNEINELKTKCSNSKGASMGLKLPNRNNEAFCNCYVDEIIQNYSRSDLERMYKLDKQVKIDSFKHILLKCLKTCNDTINVDSILIK